MKICTSQITIGHFKHSFRQNGGPRLLGPSSIKISPCDGDKVPLQQLPAPGRTVLSTLPDNRGDSKFWTISLGLQIRVWYLPNNHQSFYFL